MNVAQTVFMMLLVVFRKFYTFSEAFDVSLIRRENAINENSDKFLAYNYKNTLWI